MGVQSSKTLAIFGGDSDQKHKVSGPISKAKWLKIVVAMASIGSLPTALWGLRSIRPDDLVTQRRSFTFKRLCAVFAALFVFCSTINIAHASQTTDWTNVDEPDSTTTNGVNVKVTSSVGFGTLPQSGNMGATNFWTTPYSGTIANANNVVLLISPVETQTVTITFDKPVSNPAVHFKRFGGSNGATNSSNWLLSGSNLAILPTATRLSGSPQFNVDTTGIYRTPGIAFTTSGCSDGSATDPIDDGSNACGSAQINGRGITSLSFTVTFVGGAGAGDGLEMIWSVPDPTLAVQKVTTNGFGGSFNFTATNLSDNPDGISTTAANTAENVVPVPDNVTILGSAISITEAATAGFSFTSASCRDTNSAVTGQTGTFGTVSGSTLTVPASNVVSDAVLLCTFTNAALPDLSIAKSAPSPTLAVGSNSTYTLTVSNTGPGAATTAQIKDQLPTGMTFVSATGTDWTCANAAGLVTCDYANSTGIDRINGSSTVNVVVTPTVAIAGTSVTNYASVDPTGGAVAPTPGAACAPAAACANNISTVTSYITATSDSVTDINGVAGATSVLNAFTGDTLNSVAASASNSTLSVASGSSVPAGLTFNTATGTVDVAAGTAPGVYTFNYQICETANAANCKVAAISVTVAPYADLMITKTNGVTIVYRGTSTTYTLVVTNNGVNSITGAIVKDTPVSGLTCPSGNPVTITGSGVPAGSFTIANLMGVAGITLGILNSGESATLSYTCTIT